MKLHLIWRKILEKRELFSIFWFVFKFINIFISCLAHILWRNWKISTRSKKYRINEVKLLTRQYICLLNIINSVSACIICRVKKKESHYAWLQISCASIVLQLTPIFFFNKYFTWNWFYQFVTSFVFRINKNSSFEFSFFFSSYFSLSLMIFSSNKIIHLISFNRFHIFWNPIDT